MAQLGHSTSPTDCGSLSSATLDLDQVNHELDAYILQGAKWQPRPLRDNLPSAPTTPPDPNPLYPLEYYRSYAQHKAQELRVARNKVDYRQTILSSSYWRREAQYWASLLPMSIEDVRREIPNPIYWRLECEFWREACASQRFTADRYQNGSAEYWRIEANYLSIKITNLLKKPDTRYSINDLLYWRTEVFHYSDIIDNQMPPLTSDNSQIFNTAAEPLSEGRKRKMIASDSESEDDTSQRPTSWLRHWRSCASKSHPVEVGRKLRKLVP